jgi:DNA-binding NtrC family response regulator
MNLDLVWHRNCFSDATMTMRHSKQRGIGMRHKSEIEDDFLMHVFPGASQWAKDFRQQIWQLNNYCRLHKGAIGCVLLTGESGVGKNYTGRAISAHSQWLTLTDDERRATFYDKAGRIVLPPASLVDRLLFKEHLPQRGAKIQRVPRLATVLGPQLVDDLAASELFGHRQHSFTGAAEHHPGVFGDTAVDDVLLDEIGDLSLKVQAKLLQFIETRTFRPVGGLAAHEATSEHRLLLATNRPLEHWVAMGHFREDFYWRIQGYRIDIPPLRNRRDSMPDLVRSMLASVNQTHRGDQQARPSLDPDEDEYSLLPREDWPTSHPHASTWVTVLTDDDLQWCHDYDWPGNVRELRQRLEQYVFHNGRRRIRDVMPPQRPFHVQSSQQTNVQGIESIIGSAVHRHLDDILQGRAHAAGQPKALLGHFQLMVKNAVYQFKNDRRLNKEQLLALFPDARDAESTIGRWRPGSDDSDDL